MLQEILLSLSGTNSPLWNCIDEEGLEQNGNLHKYVSAPEKAMLASLSELSHLHIKLREATAAISASHSSMVCRAVSTAISSRYLASFRQQIVDVEASILKEEPRLVGAYNIVPLSSLVTEFGPWFRLLPWLWKTVQYIRGKQTDQLCSSARLLEFLENERYTGFVRIEEVSTQLLVAGQQTWMRSLAPWILYGNLPSSGEEDFMIRKTQLAFQNYELCRDLVPGFVTEEAADSILSIGKALNQLRSRGTFGGSAFLKSELSSKILPDSLILLQALTFPLRSSSLETAMFSINQSISEGALSRLLPLSVISKVLSVIQEYLLLDHGDFALALINHAEDRLRTRTKMQISKTPVRKLGRVDAFEVKDAELQTILKRTWSELSALRSEHEHDDNTFNEARILVRLKNHQQPESAISRLLPVPTVLDLALPHDSPLRIFLPQSDLALCSEINAYLLSIRRAETKMSNLWKLSSFRRCHPTPLGPPLSASKAGQMTLASRRRREDARNKSLRRSWASVSKVLFVLSELDAYLHAEVINNNYDHFRQWLDAQSSSRPSSAKSSSRPVTATSEHQLSLSGVVQSEELKLGSRSRRSRDDPRMLAAAHQMCLENVAKGIFLRNSGFKKCLGELLHTIDHYVAMFERLQRTWQGLDLQEDDGVEDAFSNYDQDEKDLLGEMSRVIEALERLLPELMRNIEDVEEDSLQAHMTTGVARIGLANSDIAFVPWRTRSLDRLLMKLDFLAAQNKSDDKLVEFHDAAT